MLRLDGAARFRRRAPSSTPRKSAALNAVAGLATPLLLWWAVAIIGKTGVTAELGGIGPVMVSALVVWAVKGTAYAYMGAVRTPVLAAPIVLTGLVLWTGELWLVSWLSTWFDTELSITGWDAYALLAAVLTPIAALRPRPVTEREPADHERRASPRDTQDST